jgi:hypothetical protein
MVGKNYLKGSLVGQSELGTQVFAVKIDCGLCNVQYIDDFFADFAIYHPFGIGTRHKLPVWFFYDWVLINIFSGIIVPSFFKILSVRHPAYCQN